MTERTIFLAALACGDGARRAAYLDAACAGDGALRRRVEALLRAEGGAAPAPGERAGGASSAGGTAEVTRAGEETPGGEPIGLGFLEPSDDPESLGRLGHYEVRQVLGRGGFGVVLKAFDRKLHRTVAVKVLAPYLAASATARQRFLREARAAAAVRHENVVSIHAVEDVPVPYLVMEYVAGETLQRRLDRSGPLPVREVLRVGARAARGLAAAHAEGLIHRDVKPANVLVEEGSGRVKLTDFGLARAADDSSLTQSGLVTGTPLYMAPEQATGEAVDHRADLFSLGSTLYALCTGEPPFRAGTSLGVLKRVREDEPRPVREVNPAVPAWLGDAIGRLLAKRPDDRFPSAGEVADLLEKRLAEVETPDAATVEEAPPVATWTRRRSRWIVVATGAAALVAVLALTEAAGVLPVARTVARLFASTAPPAAANENRPADLSAVAVPPQAAPDRHEPSHPADDDGAAPILPPPLPPLPPPVVTVTERKEITLPESFEEVKTGGGGRLLIFHPKGVKKLVVLDVCKGRVVGEVPLHADAVRYAAGREKLLILLPSKNVIERWDLRTFKQEKAVQVPEGSNLLAAAMGCDSSGPLALWDGDKVTLMDVEKMGPLAIEWPEPRLRPQWGYELRASADGRTFVGWVPQITSPFTLLRLARPITAHRSATQGSYKDRWAMPSADGSLVLLSDHQTTNGNLKPHLADTWSDRVLLPTADPRFFLAVQGEEIAIHTTWDREKVIDVSDENLGGMTSDSLYTHWFLVNHDEPRVRYLPDAHLLVFLPTDNRRVIVRPFNLIDELKKAGKGYLLVTSLPKTLAQADSVYTYRMDVKSSAAVREFRLDTKPDGMTISADGVLSWKVAAGEAGQRVPVIVNVKNDAGKSVVHSFQIAVE